MAAPYEFPADKLTGVLQDETKTPLVLVSCGSFSPVTLLHLRMFEMARDWVRANTAYEVVAGYMSPVGDAYKKKGLVGASHRVEMCRLGAAGSRWIMVDTWEAVKPEYTRTALVLDHFEDEINAVRGGIKTRSGQTKTARIALLSGADLLLSMSTPGVWSDEDLDHMLLKYVTLIIERQGTDLAAAIAALKEERWKKGIHSIPQFIPNDISSTKVRQLLSTAMSVRYLLPDPVVEYIEQYGLFKDTGSQ